jgi:hypothetical protein
MKHPNKNVEAWNKWRLRANRASCFHFWTSKDFVAGLKPSAILTEDALLNAIVDIRRGGKTVPVELDDL